MKSNTINNFVRPTMLQINIWMLQLLQNKANANKLVKQSMSRKGNCWDNAVAESFFKTIKVEWIYGQKFNNQQQAQHSIFEWIESWYNRHRRHSALGYQTIQEYEKNNCNFKNVA